MNKMKNIKYTIKYFILFFAFPLAGCFVSVNKYNCDLEKNQLNNARGIAVYNCSNEQNNLCNLSLVHLLKTENNFPAVCK
jgi:hypothetical protein